MLTQQLSQKKIYLTLAFGILCLSSSSILVKHLELRGLPLLGIAAYRMMLAAMLVGLPALTFNLREIRQIDRARILSMLLGGLFLALHFGTWTLSLHYIPVSRSVLLVTCHPIFTAIASRIVFGERISKRNLTAILLAFAGVVAIISESAGNMGGGGASLFGDLLALAGAVAIVGYIIIGRRLRSGVSLLTYAAIIYTTCALLLFAAALLSNATPKNIAGEDWFWLFAVAAVPTLGGHTVFNYLLKGVSATLISVAFLGEPVGATILAWVIWREIPSAATIAGGFLVLAGIYLLQIKSESK